MNKPAVASDTCVVCVWCSALFGDDRLVSNPDQVATDDNISWVRLAGRCINLDRMGSCWIHIQRLCALRTQTYTRAICHQALVVNDLLCEHAFGLGWLQDVSTYYWKTRVHNLSGVSAGQFGATTRCHPSFVRLPCSPAACILALHCLMRTHVLLHPARSGPASGPGSYHIVTCLTCWVTFSPHLWALTSLMVIPSAGASMVASAPVRNLPVPFLQRCHKCCMWCTCHGNPAPDLVNKMY